MQLKSIIDAVSKDKNLKKEVVVNAITHALERSMKKSFPFGRIEASVDEDYNLKLHHFKTVVESEPEMLDEETEVSFDEAKKIDPAVELGDELGFEVTAKIGRIESNLAKQAILEVIKNAESMTAYDQLKDKKGMIVTGIAQNTDKRGTLVSLGPVEVLVPRSETLFTDRFKRGQSYEFLLKDIELNEKGQLKVQLSRASQFFVIEALKEEVPEIASGEIEIVACARDAGNKTKIVVDNADMDSRNNPVSACIGMRGSRIQAVMHRIGGERVDVIAYSDDITKLLTGLLSGVNVRHVKEVNDEYHGEVLKEDFAKAIGKEGINVKLAARILGKKVVII